MFGLSFGVLSLWFVLGRDSSRLFHSGPRGDGICLMFGLSFGVLSLWFVLGRDSSRLSHSGPCGDGICLMFGLSFGVLSLWFVLGRDSSRLSHSGPRGDGICLMFGSLPPSGDACVKFLLGDPFFGPSPEMVSSLGSATGLPSSLCCTVGKAIGVVGLLVPFINLWVPGNSLLDAGVCRELEKGRFGMNCIGFSLKTWAPT